jgi:hypothetical protein
MGRWLTAWMTLVLLVSSCKGGGLSPTSGSGDAELWTSLLALSD